MSDANPAQPGFIARALITLIRGYQLLVAPFLGPACRFHPSCSRYTAECLRLHGAARGSYLGARRLLRCHPWNPGGYDPPPLPGAH
jgi:putative membrane protein insertion efficiency factor